MVVTTVDRANVPALSRLRGGGFSRVASPCPMGQAIRRLGDAKSRQDEMTEDG